MAPISCQGALPFWLLFRTLSARVPFYDPCVVSASIWAAFWLDFGGRWYLFGSILLSKSSLSTPKSAKHLHITAKTLFERILRSKATCGPSFSRSRKKTRHIARSTSPASIILWGRRHEAKPLNLKQYRLSKIG